MQVRIGTDIVSGGPPPVESPEIRYIIPAVGASIWLRYQFTSGNVNIDWGDGSDEEALTVGGAYRDISHTYAEGTWTARVHGDTSSMTIWRTDLSTTSDILVFPQAIAGFGVDMSIMMASESAGNGNNLARLTGLTLVWLNHKTAQSDLTLNLASLAGASGLYDLRLSDHPNVTGDTANIIGHPLTTLNLDGTGINAFTSGGEIGWTASVGVLMQDCPDWTAAICAGFFQALVNQGGWTAPTINVQPLTRTAVNGVVPGICEALETAGWTLTIS
ncbi:MAG: hypothetical protein K8R90_05175 [Candidatus Cloacimonetes bacterium]|nr:hypothetical protein [Candidatus Cloacimonadota bacterium]